MNKQLMTSPKGEYALGVDIGGTNTVVGLVDRKGNVLGTDSVKTKSLPVLEEYVKTVGNIARELIKKYDVALNDLVGMGIGAPNANYYTGNIEKAPNLPWKQEKVPLAKMISEELGIPVTITNDANAAALGEKMYGAAKNINDFIMITLGTGVGSGIVIDGKLVYGHDGFAGELGHVIIERDGRLCGCGRKGCLETYCSATGIVRTAKERNTPFQTSKDIYDAAIKGDETAIDIFRETGTRLGRALADMVAFSSPEAIILFGGLAKAGDFIVKYTREAMEENLMPIYKGKVKILLSEMKDADAAVLGASALAW
jgi:glucokinase